MNDRAGADLEVLRLRPELTAAPEFERCLKERAEQVSSFQHPCFSRVRGISRLPAPDGRLAVVSDAVKGWRLSEILQAAEQEEHLIHTSTVLFLLKQVASAVAALQGTAPGVAHGALGTERVVLSQGGMVQVVEYVLATALDHLPPQPTDRLWKELRLAVGEEVGGARFTPQNDVVQLGVLALSLLHNRQLRRDEFPGRLAELVEAATESKLTGARQPLGANLRRWLERALGLAPEAARWTMEEAHQALETVAKEGGYLSTPVGLDLLLRSVEQFFEPDEFEEEEPGSEAAESQQSPSQAGGEDAADPDDQAAPALPPSAAVARGADADVAPQARVLSIVRPTAAPSSMGAAPSASVGTQPVVVSAPLLVTPMGSAAAQAVARLPEELLDRPPATAPNPASEPDPLLFTTSPLAQFAAERVSDPLPAPQPPAVDVKPLPPPRPSLRPVPSPQAAGTPEESEDVQVGPVADMLSVDRAGQRRRSERHSSGARPVAGGITSHARTGSGGVLSAAGKAGESSPAGHAAAGRTNASEAAPRGGRTPSATASASTFEVSSPSSSLFGLSSGTEPETGADGGGGKAKWLALAGALVVCALGVGGWMLMKPSDNAGRSDSAKTESAAPASSTTAAAAPAASTATPVPSAPAAPQPAAAATDAAPAPAEPVMGSLNVACSVPVQVSEKGTALGTSGAPISLPVGRHVLDLSNEELGFSATQVVDVRVGRVSRVQVTLPEGTVNINATPWAEVLVDGQRVGETPLGNIKLTVGPHEVRFRHPQLGEQVRTIVVSARTPGRLSVDMKQ